MSHYIIIISLIYLLNTLLNESALAKARRRASTSEGVRNAPAMPQAHPIPPFGGV